MSNFGDNNSKMACSFCGKTQEQVRKIVSGPGVWICDECIRLCSEIVDEEFADADEIDIGDLPKPKEIRAVLDQYVVGQSDAKKALAVAVYNHYKRINAGDKKRGEYAGVEIQKSNVLMLGPTGCGKTLLAQTLARILKVPFAIADATSLTEAGYVGDDVENILLRLIQAADGDIERAEKGIVYIDEIDKIARKSENPSITRDVSGEGVQQALLKIIEGTISFIPPQGGRKHPHQEMMQIDTTNILFICGGAFNGIDKIIEDRLGKKTIGFGAKVATAREKAKNIGDILRQVQSADLQKSGLIPEFIGRVPVVVALDALDEDALVKIITEPKNALAKQYQKLLEMDGIKLNFDEGAVKAIAKKAVKCKTGARGLRSIIEDVMRDVMYELPSVEGASSCRITAEVVNGEQKPIISFHQTRQGNKRAATA